jgi:hypothetical protein
LRFLQAHLAFLCCVPSPDKSKHFMSGQVCSTSRTSLWFFLRIFISLLIHLLYCMLSTFSS